MNNGDTLEIDIEKLGKARFTVKANGPRKDVEWMPGKSQPPAGGGVSRV